MRETREEYNERLRKEGFPESLIINESTKPYDPEHPEDAYCMAEEWDARKELGSLREQRDKLLSACQSLVDFSYTEYAARYGEQSALQELVAIKRKARRAIDASNLGTVAANTAETLTQNSGRS